MGLMNIPLNPFVILPFTNKYNTNKRDIILAIYICFANLLNSDCI